MTLDVKIKKSDDSMDAFGGYSNSKVEEKSVVEVVGSPKLMNVLKSFHNSIGIEVPFPRTIGDVYSIDYVLSPSEISSFLELVKSDTVAEGIRLGDFVSKLLQNSYDAGYNNFTLDVEGIETLGILASNLKARKFSRMKLEVIGDTGHNFAKGSSNLDVIVHGNAGVRFGLLSKNLRSTIYGDADIFFGESSEKLKTTIYGGAYRGFGSISNYITATVFGKIVFRTMDLITMDCSSLRVTDKEYFDQCCDLLFSRNRELSLPKYLIHRFDFGNYNKFIHINEENKALEKRYFRS